MKVRGLDEILRIAFRPPDESGRHHRARALRAHEAYKFRDFASLGGRKALKVHLFAKLLELKANADAGL